MVSINIKSKMWSLPYNMLVKMADDQVRNVPKMQSKF
jgi:hypothetical protein